MKELRDLRAPGETEAQRRAWELTSAAAAESAGAARPAAPRRRRRAVAGFAAAAATAALLAITPAGAAVSDFVRSVVEDERPPARASGLEELPGGGRVLVLAAPRDGGDPAPWIAGDGVRRRLGGAAGTATWSPHGRFVAAARGAELFAVDPKGARRWSIAAPGPVRAIRWSPDGFRVAYTAGTELRVVAGDGTGDRRVAGMRPGERSAFGDLEWQPGRAAHVLAFVKRRSLFLADLDARRVLWRITVPDRPALAFAPHGDRLVLTGRKGLRVLSARDGRTLRRHPGRGFAEAAWDGAGRRLAVVRRTPARPKPAAGARATPAPANPAAGARARPAPAKPASPSRTPARAELLAGRPGRLRRLFAAGDLRLVGFSPDDRWLLVDWTETGTWLFLPLRGGRPRQLTGVAERFGARTAIPQAWCCASR